MFLRSSCFQSVGEKKQSFHFHRLLHSFTTTQFLTFLILSFFLSFFFSPPFISPTQCNLFPISGLVCESALPPSYVCPTTVITGNVIQRSTWTNCSVLVGDLYVYQLNDDITESDLGFLQTLQLIFGTVIIQENLGLYSLSFLKNVQHTYRVVLKSNPRLFDAVFVGRHADVPAVVVEDCAPLCPLFYPNPSVTGDLSCNSPDLNFLVFEVVTDYSLANGSIPVRRCSNCLGRCFCNHEYFIRRNLL